MSRDSLVYMLTAFVKTNSALKVQTEMLRVNCEAVSDEAQSVFAELSEMSSYLEVYSRLKQFLKTGAYLRAQKIRHPDFFLGTQLSVLEKELDFKSWQNRIVALSKVKGKKRVLYHSPNGMPEMSIAQTVENEGVIRETEVILKREDNSGHYDFYAYDKDGKPTNESIFFNAQNKNVVGPVPHTCMSCHYDGRTRTFQADPASFHQ